MREPGAFAGYSKGPDIPRLLFTLHSSQKEQYSHYCNSPCIVGSSWETHNGTPTNDLAETYPKMLPSQLNSPSRRANPFGRSSVSPSPGPQPLPSRPRSAVFTSPGNPAMEAKGHLRNSSTSNLSPASLAAPGGRQRSSSVRQNAPTGTFAPQFIKSEELRRGADQVRGMEGDNDFSGKRYVWLKDPEKAFVRGLVVEEKEGGLLLVQCDDGTVWTI